MRVPRWPPKEQVASQFVADFDFTPDQWAEPDEETMIKHIAASALLAAFAFAPLASPSIAFAAQESFTADLSGANGVPPIDTKGTGKLAAKLNTTSKKFSWTITYSDLSGPATAAHFHGPAAATANAAPAVPIKGKLASPIKGSAVLTAAEVKDLEGGLWYLNIHTAAHPDGEIRGQVMKATKM